jgi:hypothetical protein
MIFGGVWRAENVSHWRLPTSCTTDLPQCAFARARGARLGRETPRGRGITSVHGGLQGVAMRVPVEASASGSAVSCLCLSAVVALWSINRQFAGSRPWTLLKGSALGSDQG